MFHSRAKSHHVLKFIEMLEAAEIAICNAALTNVLTKRGDDRVRDTIAIVRRLREDAERTRKGET